MRNGEVRFRSSSSMRSGKYDHDGEKQRSGSLSDSWQSTPQLRRKLSSSEMQQSTTKNNAFSWVWPHCSAVLNIVLSFGLTLYCDALEQGIKMHGNKTQVWGLRWLDLNFSVAATMSCRSGWVPVHRTSNREQILEQSILGHHSQIHGVAAEALHYH